ncbi:MAG: nuclear transport factor 2 family protein [Thermoanaerobaculia bacterium]|nr:nuclear transport factor 2 family protein [Thermoanaerobaculia bacterium]
MQQNILCWKSILFLQAVAVVTLAALPASAQVTDPTIEEDIRRYLASYLDILESGDIERVRRQYVDDGRFSWFTDGKRLYSSPDDVARSLAEIRRTGVRLATETKDIEVILLGGGIATLRARFATRALAAEGERFAFAGIITMILERQPSGTWQVVQGHASTPGGPPERPTVVSGQE